MMENPRGTEPAGLHDQGVEGRFGLFRDMKELSTELEKNHSNICAGRGTIGLEHQTGQRQPGT